MKHLFFFFFLLFGLGTLVCATPEKILVGSPIRQKPAILREFLESLEKLDQKKTQFHFFFIDDNDQKESQDLLNAFSKKHPEDCIIAKPNNPSSSAFICDEFTHHWTDENIWKVAQFKDFILDYARGTQYYDYVFLIDSDLVLHPQTIDQLLSANKEIVSNIFWTKWTPNSALLPNAWVSDEYTLCEKERGENISQEEETKRIHTFLDKLKQPGTYEVGGLCACTLISKSALNKGVCFKKIKNLSYWGEDRHFCTRAAAIGISLFMDTHHPAFHIYRESDLAELQKQRYHPKITLSMVVRNEANRYLRKTLESARGYISNAVIIDDASTDNTIAVCKEVLQGIPLKLIQNKESQFSKESHLRKQLWDETINTNPDWILVLDADEIFEEKFKTEVQNLIANQDVNIYAFRIYDFWDESHYREDQYWKAHHCYWPFLIRYDKNIKYIWPEKPQHVGRYPYPVAMMEKFCSDLRVKHLGWSKKKDRKIKYVRYKKLDPGAKYGWKEQYESILDPRPHLVKWEE